MEPLSTRRLWWTVAGTWLGGFVVVMGAGLAVLHFMIAAVIGGLGGGLTTTDELTALGILAAGLVIGCPLLIGGTVVLRARHPSQRVQGARMQIGSAVTLLLLIALMVVRFAVLPNVGSGRYVRDYGGHPNLPAKIEAQVNSEHESSDARVVYVAFDAVDGDPGVLQAMDLLCTSRGLPAVSGSRSDPRISSSVYVEFERPDGLYRTSVPVHNVADNIKSEDDYAAVASRRIGVLLALDASHWVVVSDGPPVVYEPRDYSAFAPLLVR